MAVMQQRTDGAPAAAQPQRCSWYRVVPCKTRHAAAHVHAGSRTATWLIRATGRAFCGAGARIAAPAVCTLPPAARRSKE